VSWCRGELRLGEAAAVLKRWMGGPQGRKCRRSVPARPIVTNRTSAVPVWYHNAIPTTCAKYVSASLQLCRGDRSAHLEDGTLHCIQILASVRGQSRGRLPKLTVNVPVIQTYHTIALRGSAAMG